MLRPMALSVLALATFAVACNTKPSPPSAEPDASVSPVPAASASASAAASSPEAGPDAAPAGPRVTDTFSTTVGDLTVTPIHHATTLLRIGGKAIYIDPVDEGAVYDGLPKADYILVTDIHGDHLDPKGIAKVKKDDTVLVAPPAVNESAPAGTVLKNGESHDFTLFKVEAVPMYNLTRGPSAGKRFHDKGRGNGYVLTFGKTRVYISGDTECTPEMKALKNVDVAFLCMNLPYTMTPGEAATCANAFRPKVLIPYHYRESKLDELASGLDAKAGIELRKRDYYF